MTHYRSAFLIALAAPLLALGACGKNEDGNLSALDAELTGNAAGALRNEIVVDPAGGERSLRKTLGGLAGRQGTDGAAAGKAKGAGCAQQMEYDPAWAGRLPEPFRLYPGATLKEAAGSKAPDCGLMAISFHSDDDWKRIVDHYRARARQAGYDAEHLAEGAEQQLGGTKGDSAYIVLMNPARGGGTDVDIVAR